MSALPTILFHPQNHVGLGHANRLAAIALALNRIDASAQTPFVIEGAHHVLFDALRLPYVPLPSSHLMHETDIWANWTAQQRSSITLEIGRATIESLKPQVVVFDSIPNLSFAAAVFEKNLPVVLCLRETKEAAKYLERIEFLVPHLALVLIPHSRDDFSLPQPFAGKSCFVGKIARPMPQDIPHPRDPAGDATRIVISGGGGGYPGTVDFYNLALKAFAQLRSDGVKAEARLIVGPLFVDWHLLELCTDVSVIPFDPGIARTFAAADLVICQAGYNTVAELEQMGSRTILVPATRRWDDQFARARKTGQENLQFRVFQRSSAEDLAALALELLRTQVSMTRGPIPAEGARKAAERLYEMCKAG